MPQASLYIYIYKDSHSGAMVCFFALLTMIVALLLMERNQDTPFHIVVLPLYVDMPDYHN